MNNGFYTALGTPTEKDGTFIPESMELQIEQQIENGAAGLLIMGSMGKGTFMRNREFTKVAETSVNAVKGRCPALVCVSDICIERVMDKVETLKDIKGIDGIVSTIPYYSAPNQEEICTFYKTLADRSPYPVYLYDLAVVTKVRTMPETIMRLWKHPNIGGIKSGNLVTHRILQRSGEMPEHFDAIFSNIDEFDIAYPYGVSKNLDGMFSAVPKTTGKMYRALAAGDQETGSKCLDDILRLRDYYCTTKCLMSAYTVSMNLLGCRGYFGTDYQPECSEKEREGVERMMKELGEI